MKIGNREFQTKGHTYVMGILNVTPDSFSDGGKWNDRRQILTFPFPWTPTKAVWQRRGSARERISSTISGD